MDEKGSLMNLSKVEDPASEYASKYLQGRQRYILVRAVRESLGSQPCSGGSSGEGSALQPLGHSPEALSNQKPAQMKS